MDANISQLAVTLADQPFFSMVRAGTLCKLAEAAYHHEYAPGEVIFGEREPADRFFLICSGLVRLETETSAWGRLEVEKIGVDCALGWSWLFSPYRWHFTATAVERTRVIVFDAADLRLAMARDPVLGYELMRQFAAVIVERLQATRLRLVSARHDLDSTASAEFPSDFATLTPRD